MQKNNTGLGDLVGVFLDPVGGCGLISLHKVVALLCACYKINKWIFNGTSFLFCGFGLVMQYVGENCATVQIWLSLSQVSENLGTGF